MFYILPLQTLTIKFYHRQKLVQTVWQHPYLFYHSPYGKVLENFTTVFCNRPFATNLLAQISVQPVRHK